jgi:AraC-like DNA-binding protein
MGKKIHIHTIPEFHKLAGLPEPANDFLSVVKLEELKWKQPDEKTTIIRDFYIVAWKKIVNIKFKYGQHEMISVNGSLHFMAPKQVLTIDASNEKVNNKGLLLLIHQSFILGTSLAKKMMQLEYFKYQFNQVLPINYQEEVTIITLLQQIAYEQHQLKASNTKDVIIAQVELLLAYIERYYRKQQSRLTGRQGHHILDQLEKLIDDYLHSPHLISNGIPTIKYLSYELHISPNYLSRLIQSLTGQSTQQLVQEKLITLAKEMMSGTSSSISEVAYQLGFSSPQSFSRLFKAKTNQTPSEFKNAFK